MDLKWHRLTGYGTGRLQETNGLLWYKGYVPQTNSLCYKSYRLLVALESCVEVLAVLFDGMGGVFGKAV